MPTVEEVGNRWIHPKTNQVRYYVANFRDILGIDAPEKVKVWMDRFGRIRVTYCDDIDLEIQIVRAMDKFMRGDRKVVGTYSSNCEVTFRVIPSTKFNSMSYDNIESAKKRMLTLRKAGFHVARLTRNVEKHGEVYTVFMDDTEYYQYYQTPGYQRVDMLDWSDDDNIWMIYHGEDVMREYQKR